MTDDELMYATLLALTRQNVTGEAGAFDGFLLGDFNGLVTTGWIDTSEYIYGGLIV